MTPTGTRLERTIDWAIGLVSPRKAALRSHFRRWERDEQYRQSFDVLLRMRGYRAAKTPEGQTPWFGGSGSADAEILGDLPKLRARSREINRDDPIASGLTNTFVTNVIGSGLRPRVRSKDEATNVGLEAIWNERKDSLFPAEQMTCAEWQSLLFRKAGMEDGEIGVKVARRGRGTPAFFEAIEAERIATPMQKSADKRIVDGVEKDDIGVPVAYWVNRKHPGETLTVATTGDFERVVVESMLLLKTGTRPGQTRGVPRFHAMLQDLRDLDLLLLAALKRTQIAACLAAFIKTDASVAEILDVTARKYGYRLDQTIEPGMLFALQPGESIETLIPNFPTPELGPFIIMLARRIGAALGVSWQIVLKDFGDSTYSSARTDLLEARQVYVALRRWFIEKCMRWVWRQVIEDARLRGDRRAQVADAVIDGVEWFGDGWRWIDPAKEVQSFVEAEKAGIVVLEDIWMEMGKDPDEMRERVRESLAWKKKVGLVSVASAVAGDDTEDESPSRRFALLAGLNGAGNGRH